MHIKRIKRKTINEDYTVAKRKIKRKYGPLS